MLRLLDASRTSTVSFSMHSLTTGGNWDGMGSIMCRIVVVCSCRARSMSSCTSLLCRDMASRKVSSKMVRCSSIRCARSSSRMSRSSDSMVDSAVRVSPCIFTTDRDDVAISARMSSRSLPTTSEARFATSAPFFTFSSVSFRARVIVWTWNRIRALSALSCAMPSRMRSCFASTVSSLTSMSCLNELINWLRS